MSRRDGNMPRKKRRTTTNDTGKRTQFNVSFTPSYAGRIEDTAEALGLDGTSLIRMIVREHLGVYEDRAKVVRASDPPAGKPPK